MSSSSSSSVDTSTLGISVTHEPSSNLLGKPSSRPKILVVETPLRSSESEYASPKTKELPVEHLKSEKLLQEAPLKQTSGCCTKSKCLNVALIIIGIVGAGGLAFGVVGFLVPVHSLPTWMAAAMNTVGHGGIIGFTAGGGVFVLVGFAGIINAIRQGCKKPKQLPERKLPVEEKAQYKPKYAHIFEQLTGNRQYIAIKNASEYFSTSSTSETYTLYIRHDDTNYERKKDVSLAVFARLMRNNLKEYTQVKYKSLEEEIPIPIEGSFPFGENPIPRTIESLGEIPVPYGSLEDGEYIIYIMNDTEKSSGTHYVVFSRTYEGDEKYDVYGDKAIYNLMHGTLKDSFRVKDPGILISLEKPDLFTFGSGSRLKPYSWEENPYGPLAEGKDEFIAYPLTRSLLEKQQYNVYCQTAKGKRYSLEKVSASELKDLPNGRLEGFTEIEYVFEL